MFHNESRESESPEEPSVIQIVPECRESLHGIEAEEDDD